MDGLAGKRFMKLASPPITGLPTPGKKKRAHNNKNTALHTNPPARSSRNFRSSLTTAMIYNGDKQSTHQASTQRLLLMIDR